MSSKCLQILGLLPQSLKRNVWNKICTISAILGEFLIERAPAFSSSSKANATHIQLTGRELLFSGFLLRISLFHVNFSGGCFHSRTKGPSMYLVLPFIVIDSVQPKPLVWFRSDTVIDTKTTFWGENPYKIYSELGQCIYLFTFTKSNTFPPKNSN